MTPDLFKLTGKVAVVTGCNTGLGQAMALALAEAGADIIGASRSEDIAETRALLQATGRKFVYHRVDLSDREQLYAFVEKVKSENPRIDILVNNAGIIMRKPAAEHPDEYWDKVMAVNLDAQFILGREFGRQMVEQGSGKIIFICSLLSFQGGINVPGYTASKSAVAGLARLWK
jgi:2-dehydro-3-deoxy-D-gluconate 5-dehydrogenase